MIDPGFIGVPRGNLTPRKLMGTSYRLLLPPINVAIVALHRCIFSFSFEMCLTLFMSILLDNCLVRVVVFDFRLSQFGLYLSQYLGLRLSLVGYVYFQHCIYFCCFSFSLTTEVG